MYEQLAGVDSQRQRLCSAARRVKYPGLYRGYEYETLSLAVGICQRIND